MSISEYANREGLMNNPVLSLERNFLKSQTTTIYDLSNFCNYMVMKLVHLRRNSVFGSAEHPNRNFLWMMI